MAVSLSDIYRQITGANIPKIGCVVGLPKALCDIQGITYIYAMLYRFGLIDAPEKAKEKMNPSRDKDSE